MRPATQRWYRLRELLRHGWGKLRITDALKAAKPGGWRGYPQPQVEVDWTYYEINCETDTAELAVICDLPVCIEELALWLPLLPAAEFDYRAPPPASEKKNLGGRPVEYLWLEWKQALDAWLTDNPLPKVKERLMEWSRDWFEDNDVDVPDDKAIRERLKPYYSDV